ncbi:hypothetical protein HHK36_003762 [Tetracentron sinense]|uniref:Uncharacterized protein n=1 Tax=Tetracentron sinense TaxID=13715 RepID=A0A834Y696_TETSI|nr:hypothetical protein HHK36_031782 [Tetracentron sinense]KAF8411218.1 hypothetical protein HHK36_003762 [Tetracentron sinense]
MAAWAAAARQVTSLTRLSTPTSAAHAAKLVQRRGLAGGGDHHGPPRINVWQDPMSPSKWKEEHFVIVSLSGWGLLFYGGYKLFSGGKKEKKEEVLVMPSKDEFRNWVSWMFEIPGITEKGRMHIVAQ